MPVRKEPDGQRSVQAEAEVPGTPEQVWQAIATGPGMSAWFVPSTSEERVGGTATNNFGPGMESVASITQWNPPHSFTAETEEEPGKVATEWTVEARDGGKCIVRVVHRWFASTDDWDNQFEGHTQGWLAFFRILNLYLAHFPGQQSTAFQLLGFSKKDVAQTWSDLTAALGMQNDSQQVKPAAGMPPLSGTIEKQGDESHPEMLIRLEQPAPGAAHLFIMPMGGQMLVSIRFYFYGEAGANVGKQTEADWTTWLTKQYPA